MSHVDPHAPRSGAISPAAVPDVTALAQTIRKELLAYPQPPNEGQRRGVGALAALLALVERREQQLGYWCKEAKRLLRELARTRQERDEANERMETRLEDDSVFRVYDEMHERALAAERERDAAQERERGLREALPAFPVAETLAACIEIAERLYEGDEAYYESAHQHRDVVTLLAHLRVMREDAEIARAALAAADTPQPDRETTDAPLRGAG